MMQHKTHAHFSPLTLTLMNNCEILKNIKYSSIKHEKFIIQMLEQEPLKAS